MSYAAPGRDRFESTRQTKYNVLMDSPSPPQRPMQDLARRLLAAEATLPCASQLPSHAAVRVCDTLRISLTRFAGADGFASLLRRALVLARAELPALQSIQIGAEGGLEGFEQLATGTGAAAAAAITAHLLGLLVTFIGEPLTLTLVREAWPDTSLGE